MRRFIMLAVVVLTMATAYAYEKYIGVIVSTGSSVTNTSTGTPFKLPGDQPLAIQCDAQACVKVGYSANGETVTASCSATTGDVVVAANTLYDVPMVTADPRSAVDTIAVISSSGTANCRVYRVVTP